MLRSIQYHYAASHSSSSMLVCLLTLPVGDVYKHPSHVIESIHSEGAANMLKQENLNTSTDFVGAFICYV